MKKYLLWILTGLLLFASCSKEEEKMLLGKWIFDNDVCTSQKQYSDIYKSTYPDATIDETIHHNPANMIYGYWDFNNTEVHWYYQYVNGDIQKNKGSYHIQDDVLYVGATPYKIIEQGDKKLTTQYIDTTCFYDENYEKQIAWKEIWTFKLNKE